MTLQKLASDIAKLEGKKSQARIGDIREILKLLSILEGAERVKKLFASGYREALYEMAYDGPMHAIERRTADLAEIMFAKEEKRRVKQALRESKRVINSAKKVTK